MALVASYVDKLKPALAQSLQAAITAGSSNLDTLNQMLTIAIRTGDQSLVAEIELRIAGDSQAVKVAFAVALVEVAKEAGLQVVVRSGEATGKRRGRPNKVKQTE